MGFTVSFRRFGIVTPLFSSLTNCLSIYGYLSLGLCAHFHKSPTSWLGSWYIFVEANIHMGSWCLVQICGESECLIIQMLFLDVIPWALVDFLKDPNIVLPGVGVKGDAKKLQKDWGLECNGALDLTSLAVKALRQPELKHVGLKALAKIVIGYEMAKSKRVTMSNWAKPVLDNLQVEYATLDAWVSYAIHQRLVGDS